MIAKIVIGAMMTVFTAMASIYMGIVIIGILFRL